jgi:hypothetical protein
MVLLKMGLNREIGNIPGIENKSPSLNGWNLLTWK